jgi:hypothetical protein
MCVRSLRENPGGRLLMPQDIPASSKDEHQPDAPEDRAAWTRPALHRLRARNADVLQKEANDGAQGKGMVS